VSASSPSDVWAAGDNGGLNPVVLRFDGRWRLVHSPAVRVSILGLKAFAPDDVWAVGEGGIGVAFVMHWDGMRWTSMEVPQPGDYSTLFAIDGSSPSDMWAVGDYFTLDGIKGLGVHYDGTSWTLVPMDDVSPFLNSMESVEVIAADDVWAVGRQQISWDVDQPLAQHWDGTAWTAVPIELPPPDLGNSFFDVSASSSTDVWAVGTYGESFPLMEHWDGTEWTRYRAPVQHLAWGVAAISPTHAWAAGSGVPPASWHWDGASWSPVRTPYVGSVSGIADLVALSDRDI
jgi:hypothetical protein